VRLGQGRENAKQFLVINPDLADEIREAVLQSKGLMNAKRTMEAAAGEVGEPVQAVEPLRPGSA